MTRWAQDRYVIKNPQKYIGKKQPFYRSSWEFSFMRFCDLDERILKWASEAISIPYKDPLTNRNTIYVPDFLIVYADKSGMIHNEIIEIKPQNQTLLEKVGKNRKNQLHYIKNQAKWQAAYAFCKKQGLTFRVLNEQDLFLQTGKRKR